MYLVWRSKESKKGHRHIEITRFPGLQRLGIECIVCVQEASGVKKGSLIERVLVVFSYPSCFAVKWL